MFGHDDNQQQNQMHQTDQSGQNTQQQNIQTSNNQQPVIAPTAPPDGFNLPGYSMQSDNSLADLATPEIPAHSTPNTNQVPQNINGDELVSIKQQALQSLSPLVGKLDQTPEEKFRTTMMMIQASDNQGLIKDAFEAAKAITDDKSRAQALLDVINEINYFTQHQN